MSEQANKPSISVILPTYNEADNIAELIDRIFQTLGTGCEVIVVDDDSPDGTWSIVSKMAIDMGGLRLIRRTKGRGLTSAIQEGIDASKGNLVAWMDCDLSMPPEHFPSLICEINSGSDIAIGSRYAPGGADLRNEKLSVVLSSIISFLCRTLLNKNIRDYTSGFIVARRSVFDQIRLRGDYGEYFIDLMYNATRRKFTITEVPYKFISRKKGLSKTSSSTFKLILRGRKYLTTLCRLFANRLFSETTVILALL